MMWYDRAIIINKEVGIIVAITNKKNISKSFKVKFVKVSVYLRLSEIAEVEKYFESKGIKALSSEDLVELSVISVPRLGKKVRVLESIIKQSQEQKENKE